MDDWEDEKSLYIIANRRVPVQIAIIMGTKQNNIVI